MNFEPFFEASLAIQVHLITALLALALGGAILFRKKGGAIHRFLGKTWVGIFAVTVVSSAFISELQTFGRFSAIHLLTVFSAVSLVLGIYFIRNKKIAHHKYTMQGLYLGGLVGAGLLSLLPNRILHRILFTDGEFSSGVPLSPALSAFGTAALVYVGQLTYNWYKERSV